MNDVKKQDQVFSENGKYGLASADGSVLLPAVFDDFKLLSGFTIRAGQKVVARLGDKYGIAIAGTEGEWLIEPMYDDIAFPNMITAVKKGEKWGFLNTQTLEMVIPVELDTISNGHSFPFVNGVGYFQKDDKWGVILEDGTYTAAVFDEAEPNDSGVIEVRQGNVSGWIDQKGQLTTDENDAWFME
jgi:hypothetical protein